MADCELGALLSGGLDSSLVSAVAAQICRQNGRRLKTFCISIDPDAPDCKAAKICAFHIGSDHTTIIINEEEWLKVIPEVIRTIESCDTTSVRASTGQLLISKWVRENTNVKVLNLGDFSDEMLGSYLYFHNAPNDQEFHQEVLKLINNIHWYDLLRSDRCVSGSELEARVPFARRSFIETYLSINIELRRPKNQFVGIENIFARGFPRNRIFTG